MIYNLACITASFIQENFMCNHIILLHFALPDRRVASMTAEQLANLSHVEDMEEMADDLAQQFGVSGGGYHNRTYSDQDIIDGLSDKDSSQR